MLVYKENGILHAGDLKEKLIKLKDGAYLVEIVQINSDVDRMRKYYRGVVLPTIAKFQHYTIFEQHEELLKMHSPKITMGGKEYDMRTRGMEKEHWLFFLTQVIDYWSQKTKIPEAMKQIYEGYVQDTNIKNQRDQA